MSCTVVCNSQLGLVCEGAANEGALLPDGERPFLSSFCQVSLGVEFEE